MDASPPHHPYGHMHPLLPMLLLNTTNHLAVRGPITAESTRAFFDAAMRTSWTELHYVYLDTPGGSVSDGQRIAAFVQQRNLTCIAQRAHSMGFVLLQYCGRRWITPHGSAMQHQISLQHVQGELRKVQEQLAAIARVDRELARVQANRLGVSADWFQNRTRDEWWMSGTDALAQGAADELVYVECTQALARRNVSLARPPNVLGEVTFEDHSACPLIT